jgi:hypothetical protein
LFIADLVVGVIGTTPQKWIVSVGDNASPDDALTIAVIAVDHKRKYISGL